MSEVQGGAEPTETFQMVIDNIWKQGKISETVYKYVQVCYLLPTDYKLIFWKLHQTFTLMHCCKRVWNLPYTRLRRSSSIAETSSTMACLSSWIVMIRLRNTRSFRNPHKKKSGTVRSGDRAGQAMSPKGEITVPNIVARSNDPLRLTLRNGVLSSTVLLPANHNKLSRRRNIQIWNVSVGSAPPGILEELIFASLLGIFFYFV